MNREQLRKIWEDMGLSCRESITPEYAEEFTRKCELPFDKTLVYTKNRWREQSNGEPRVDCEDLLIYVCEKLHIEPDKKRLEYSKVYLGEGSRRQAVEEAYLSESIAEARMKR